MKKTIAVLLIAVLLLSLCACGQSPQKQLVGEWWFTESLSTDDCCDYGWGLLRFTTYEGDSNILAFYNDQTWALRTQDNDIWTSGTFEYLYDGKAIQLMDSSDHSLISPPIYFEINKITLTLSCEGDTFGFQKLD